MTQPYNFQTPFTGLSEEICGIAWDHVLQSLRWSGEFGIANKLAGCIIVLDPSPYQHGDGVVDLPILFFDTVGERDDNQKYITIASEKAYVSWRTCHTSGFVQHDAPYLYRPGDVKWGGSTVLPGGLVIAFSGVQAVLDEAVSESMGSWIKGICRLRMREVMDAESAYLR